MSGARHVQPERTWEQVAEELGITVAQARRHAREGLERLRAMFEAEGYTREQVLEAFEQASGGRYGREAATR